MERREVLEWLFSQEASGIKFGLENIRELLWRLGNPQDKFRSVHVAGTNGKGSVSASTASVLKEAGYVTGLYTSPHLRDFRERIRVDSVPINDECFMRLAEEVRQISYEMMKASKKLTFFELTTAIAFAYFAEMQTDIAVIEVGMGGRLDATNVIHPELSIITPVSIEHQDYLGNTLEEIAAEKAGIIKPGVPVISADQPEEVLKVLHSKTDDLTILGRNSQYAVLNSDEYGTDIYSEALQMELHTPLIGRYQGDNAALAAAAVKKLMELGIYIPDEAICKGFSNVRWPARLEIVSEEPRIIIDSTHTPAGAQAAAEEIKRLFGRVILVFGVLCDKDLEGIAAYFGPVSKKVFTAVPSSPRARPAEDSAAVFKKYAETAAAGSLRDAVCAAVNSADKNDTVLITGSLYMAGEAMEVLHVPEAVL